MKKYSFLNLFLAAALLAGNALPGVCSDAAQGDGAQTPPPSSEPLIAPIGLDQTAMPAAFLNDRDADYLGEPAYSMPAASDARDSGDQNDGEPPTEGTPIPAKGVTLIEKIKQKFQEIKNSGFRDIRWDGTGFPPEVETIAIPLLAPGEKLDPKLTQYVAVLPNWALMKDQALAAHFVLLRTGPDQGVSQYLALDQEAPPAKAKPKDSPALNAFKNPDSRSFDGPAKKVRPFIVEYTKKDFDGFHSKEFGTAKAARRWLFQRRDRLYWSRLRKTDARSARPHELIDASVDLAKDHDRINGVLTPYFETGMESIGLVIEDGALAGKGGPNPSFDPSKPEDGSNFRNYTPFEALHPIREGDILEIDGKRYLMKEDPKFAAEDGHRLSYYPSGFSRAELEKLFFGGKTKAVLWTLSRNSR